MKTCSTRVGIALLTTLVAGLALATTAQADRSGWRQIFLNGPIETKLADGSTRTLDPSCSTGPTRAPDGSIVPANPQYSFFIREGNPNKLLVALDGGGACWDAFTCLGSPLAGSSTYAQAVDENPARLGNGEGLFDRRNPENPFKEYTQVFVPYCSGDVHWGSKDTTYTLPTPAGPLPWTIRHRGTDNFLAVIDWLRKNGRREYRVDLGRVQDVTVTGASAGGYGAMIAYAHVAELTPRARHNLLADASIGVLTQSVFDKAIYNPASPDSVSWGVQDSLPPWVPGFALLLPTASVNPNLLVPLAFQSLSAWKPDAHYGSLTTHLDLTQVFFYALMKGELSPSPATAAEWYFGMKGITSATASLPNYRYFIDAGTTHTFIGNDALTYGVGVNGVSVAEWIRAMIKPGNRQWENLDAGPPF